MSAVKLSKDQQEKTKRIFAALDTDRSGYIEVRELGPVVKLLETLSISIDQKSLQNVVGKFDKSKSGRLNQEQFSQMLVYLLEIKNNVSANSAATVTKVTIKDAGGSKPTVVVASASAKAAPSSTRTVPSASSSAMVSKPSAVAPSRPPPGPSSSKPTLPPASAPPRAHAPVASKSSTPPSRFKAPLRQIKKTFLSYHKQLNTALTKDKEPSAPPASMPVSVSISVSTKEPAPKAAASVAVSKSHTPTFVDGAFPANSSVLPRHAAGGVVSWKRPHEMCDNPRLFVDGAEEGDVVQGGLGDCWFIGALAVLASSGNDFIEQTFVKADVRNGEYQCKFYKDGKWVIVTVDDRLPCGASGRPYFASCPDPNEWWVPIVEKAYAKLHGGYEALESGTITDALKDMSGEAVEILRVDEDPQFKDKSVLWKTLLEYTKESFLMGCAIENSAARSEQENEWGLLANHAYSIIDCQEVQGHKLLRVRNPWGKGEWKGAWSDGSKEWTPALKKHFQFEFGNDGTFFMRFEDFVRFYNRIHVLCLLTDDQGEVWHKSVIRGQWKGETAGGCTNNPTWSNNPQYALSSASANNKVFVGLSQPDLRYKHKKSPAKAGLRYEPIGLIVLKTPEHPPTQKKTSCGADDREVAPVFMGQRDSSCDFVAQKDKSYILLPCTFNPRVEQTFELLIYSQRPVKLTELSAGAGSSSKGKK